MLLLLFFSAPRPPRWGRLAPKRRPILYYAIPYRTVPYYTTYTMLYYNILIYTMLNYDILFYAMLCYTILYYYTILYRIHNTY